MSPPDRPNSRIHVGIGGWLYEPWRGTFYPEGLAHHRELAYASRQLDMIEINSTYYRSQTPETFAKWRDDTPDDFVFSVKAPMYATNRRVLADAGEIVEKFVNGGVGELRSKLGPIVWEFAPTKVFDALDFAAFLRLVPRTIAGMRARHVLDVRHPSFKSTEFLAMARKAAMACAFTDADDPASFADVTADFVYTRVKRSNAKFAKGMKAQVIDRLAERARVWAAGGEPDDVPRVEEPQAVAPHAVVPQTVMPQVAAVPSLPRIATPQAPLQVPPTPREVFVLIVSGDKEKAPLAAIALRKKLSLEKTLIKPRAPRS